MKANENMSNVREILNWFQRLLKNTPKKDLYTELIKEVQKEIFSVSNQIRSASNGLFFKLANYFPDDGAKKTRMLMSFDNFSDEVINEFFAKKGDENNFRNDIINSINKIGEFLDDTGFLEKFCSISNTKFANQLFLSQNKIELGKKEDPSTLINEISKVKTIYGINKKVDKYMKTAWNGKEPITAREIFMIKNLRNLTSNKLILIAGFWTNKIVKILENTLNVLLLISSKKFLLEGIKRGDIAFETIEYWLNEQQYEFSQKELNNLLDIWKDNSNDFPEYLLKVYSYEDLVALRKIYVAIHKLYVFKTVLIYSSIVLFEETKEFKNYGIVVEKSDNKSNFIIFMFDIPGYNLPVSYHIPKSEFKKFIEIFEIDKIKRYYGAEDFFNSNIQIKNSLLFPFCKKYKENVLGKRKINKTLEHISFIQNGVWPEHLKNEKNAKDNNLYVIAI